MPFGSAGITGLPAAGFVVDVLAVFEVVVLVPWAVGELVLSSERDVWLSAGLPAAGFVVDVLVLDVVSPTGVGRPCTTLVVLVKAVDVLDSAMPAGERVGRPA